MADCTPKTIEAAAKCLDCNLTHKQAIAALVYVLCTVNSMSCTPTSLMAGAKCIMCLTEKQLIAAAVYLICTGGTGGGGSGTQQVYQDHTGSPPDDPTKPALSFPTGGGGVSEWDVVSQTWI